MTLTEFGSILSAHLDKTMRFVLPGGKSIPPQYHITEVGHVRKDFIDCGGTIRSSSSCVLQAWVALNDEDHRLVAGKLSAILKLADKILPGPDLAMELEYEAPILSQFSIVSSEIATDAVVFHLQTKHTDCLAKESCGLEGGSCCADEEDCCGSDESAPVTQGKSSCC